MNNLQIADALDQVADLLQVERENPFKVRAFRRAARTVEGHPVEMAELVARGGDPRSLPGVGHEIAACIRELLATGRLARLEALARQAPASLAEVMRLPGVGPRRARRLWEALGIATLDDLQAAAAAGRVAAVAGFGERTEARLLAALAERRAAGRRLLLSAAEVVLESLLAHLAGSPAIEQVAVAGSFRRRRETVGDLDLVAVSRSPAAVLARFTGWPPVSRVEGAGDTRATVVTRRGLAVDLRVVPPESFGAALLYLTGSKEHNVALRARALARGWRLSEWGLFAERGAGKRLAGASEEEVYAALGLGWVPPELREGEGEIEAAANGRLPTLVRGEQLRGDLQMHTTWSDGRAGVAQMVAACVERGYEYCALTDHGPGLPVVRGLDGVRLRAQHAEIAQVQRRYPQLRVLRALEVDVLADGTLALPDEQLAGLELVLAAVHSALRLPAEEQTRRYLRALAHPRVAILAHPTARRLGRRGRVEADWDAIFAAAAQHGVAVEANASPERLDLDGTLLRRACELGCRVVISTDAHSTRELANLRFGVDQARRGWLQAGDVLNTRPLAELLGSLRGAAGDRPAASRQGRRRRARRSPRPAGPVPGGS